MAASKRFIEELYAETALGVTESGESWARFLASAARNYKLPFHEQLLVFAQRPAATAVLELERWNSLFGRWVNRGARGIAVFPESGGRRLKYYFDISDTHPGSSAREVPVWSAGDIDGEAARRALSEEYGLSPDGDLMSMISDACSASAGTDLAPYEAEAGALALVMCPRIGRIRRGLEGRREPGQDAARAGRERRPALRLSREGEPARRGHLGGGSRTALRSVPRGPRGKERSHPGSRGLGGRESGRTEERGGAGPWK